MGKRWTQSIKTLEAKALFDKVLAHLERLRDEPEGGSVRPTASAECITDQIKK
jgi:hypothetical protein